jgi:hypothetical protein
MSTRSTTKRLLTGIGAAVVILLSIAVAWPVWFPWALRPVLKKHGAEFNRCHRLGYGRFALTDLAYRQHDLAGSAHRVEFSLSLLRRSVEVDVADWQLTIRPGPPAVAAEPTIVVLDEFESSLPDIRTRLPRARLANGVVQFGAEKIVVPELNWDGGKLTGRIESPRLAQSISLAADLTQPALHTLTAQVEPAGLKVETQLSRDPVGWRVDGRLVWLENDLKFAGAFGSHDHWPGHAQLMAERFRVPAESLQLDGYEDVTGSLAATWESGKFDVRLAVRALPATPTDQLPPVEADLFARGDLDSVSLEKFSVTTPWLRVKLSNPVELTRTMKLISAAADLEVEVYLAKLPGAPAEGELRGTVRVEPAATGYPGATFALAGSALRARDVAIEAAQLTGEIDLQARRVIAAEIAADGFVVPGLLPVTLTANWREKRFDAQARAGQSVLDVEGAAEWPGPVVELARLSLRRDDAELYRLAQPSRISLRPERLSIEELRLVGPDRQAMLSCNVEWPRRGKIAGRVVGLALADFRDFLREPARDFSVDELTMQAHWDDGPMRFELDARGGLTANGQLFSVRAHVVGDDTGIKVEPLTVQSEEIAVVSVRGTIPATLVPGRAPWLVKLMDDGRFDLRATTEPEPAFWEQLAKLTGVRAVDPDLELSVTGTPASPAGTVRLRARSLDWRVPGKEWALPKVENLHGEAEINRASVALKFFRFEVEGQPVRLTGELPLEAGFWTALVTQGTMPDWTKANAQLQIDRAQIAPFIRYLPPLLTPQGQLNVDLALQPGGKLAGQLTLTDAATRPVLPGGPIRDVEARVLFEDRTARLETFRGQIGGQPVSLTGRIGLPERGPVEMELALRGMNVPLVREPGLVLRSDLDLQLAQTTDRPAKITGEVVFRDSVFLQDLTTLLPVGLAAPGQRPPYFSVAEEPFADWTLDVKLRGERFLRVRSPLFRGELSAAFRLGGTLREPVVVGEARINEGSVLFPFVSLRVEHGLISLTTANPYRPELFLSAAGRSYGYNVNMLMRGPADEPVVTFSSTPPLSSDEIVLMLTAGELPRTETPAVGQQRASRLALYFGRELLTHFGVDEATAERLEIRAGEDVTEQGAPTYYIEYRLTDRFSVIGEYDRFNALNASLKWRIFSR